MKCLITGCNGGIGKKLCKGFYEDGYFVYGLDKVGDKNRWCDKFLNIDLTESDFDLLPEEELDLLINCAAVQKVKDFHEFSESEIQEIFDVNIISVISLIRNLKFSENSNIINIGSVHSSQTKNGFSIYATTKGALESLTKSLSLELAPKTRVNMIKPAAVDTEMLKSGLTNEGYKKLNKYHPVEKIGEKENVLNLCREVVKNDFLNGSILELDGGISNILHDPSII